MAENRVDTRLLERVVDVGPVPTDALTNASYVLAYTGTTLDSVTMTVNGVAYVRSLTWTGSNLTAVSTWSVV